MSRYDFLVETYRTERIKTLSVWSQFDDKEMEFRPEGRARTPHEHMVHQCISEDNWMKKMLGIDTKEPALPSVENRIEFIKWYAALSEIRLKDLGTKPDEWFEEETEFFEVVRSRAWVLTRRIAHTAHHRGQLTAYLRILGKDLYSTYGPSADTGGLPQNKAAVIYRYHSITEMISAEAVGGIKPPLPGPGSNKPTESPRSNLVGEAQR
jgi:uncharacterized damage-inducible protein DinB